jgi:hypothetical protein
VVDDVVTRTACGLYVMRGSNPRGWANFSWTTEVVDMPGNEEDQFALSFVQKDIMEQLGSATDGGVVLPTDVAFACLHEGDVPRVEYQGLDGADPEVPMALIDQEVRLRQTHYTVCGILQDEWQPAEFHAVAGSPLVAYFKAWEFFRDFHGSYLLLAAVHPGNVPNIGTFKWADPWAANQLEMDSKARSWEV